MYLAQGPQGSNAVRFKPSVLSQALYNCAPFLTLGVELPQKHVRYKTWNRNSLPLPTSTPPRHIQSCKQWTVDQIVPPPPPPHTHKHINLRCIDFLICAGKSTYGRFMVLVVPHSALYLAAVCDWGISWLCSLTFSKKNSIKGHLLKSNIGSDICFTIMHTPHGLYNFQMS